MTVTLNLTEATIATLALEPDDIVVLRITDPSFKPSAELVGDMRSRVRATLGDPEREIIVLGYGLELEIVKRPEGT